MTIRATRSSTKRKSPPARGEGSPSADNPTGGADTGKVYPKKVKIQGYDDGEEEEAKGGAVEMGGGGQGRGGRGRRRGPSKQMSTTGPGPSTASTAPTKHVGIGRGVRVNASPASTPIATPQPTVVKASGLETHTSTSAGPGGVSATVTERLGTTTNDGDQHGETSAPPLSDRGLQPQIEEENERDCEAAEDTEGDSEEGQDEDEDEEEYKDSGEEHEGSQSSSKGSNSDSSDSSSSSSGYRRRGIASGHMRRLGAPLYSVADPDSDPDNNDSGKEEDQYDHKTRAQLHLSARELASSTDIPGLHVMDSVLGSGGILQQTLQEIFGPDGTIPHALAQVNQVTGSINGKTPRRK